MYLVLFMCLGLGEIPRAQLAEVDTTYRHHVILLVDRSRGVGPLGRDDSDIKGIINELEDLCFNNTGVLEEGALLVPDRDYLSVYPYGLSKNEEDFDDFINLTDPIYMKLSQGFDKEVFSKQLNSGGYKYGQFRKSFSFSTIVVSEALGTFSDNQKNFTRTFVILFSDGALNTDNSGTSSNPDSEFEGEMNQAGIVETYGKDEVNEIKNRRAGILRHYSLVPIPEADRSVERSFKYGRKLNSAGNYYQGLDFNLTLYELTPNLAGATIQGVYDYLNKPVKPLQRTENGRYIGHWPLTVAQTRPEFIEPVAISAEFFSAQNELLMTRNISLSDGFDNLIRAELPDLTSDVQVQLGLTATIKNPYYNGTVVTPAFFPAFTDRVIWGKEEDALILGKKMPNWMLKAAPGDSQSTALIFYKRLTTVLGVVLLLFTAYTFFLKLRPRKPKQEEFQVKGGDS